MTCGMNRTQSALAAFGDGKGGFTEQSPFTVDTMVAETVYNRDEATAVLGLGYWSKGGALDDLHKTREKQAQATTTMISRGTQTTGGDQPKGHDGSRRNEAMTTPLAQAIGRFGVRVNPRTKSIGGSVP
ncbi:hypothetical protein VTO42DRAFT_6870 [Malbranchea cinnamomea]